MIKFPVVDFKNIKVSDNYVQVAILRFVTTGYGRCLIKCPHGDCYIGSAECDGCDYNQGYDYQKLEIECSEPNWVDFIFRS